MPMLRVSQPSADEIRALQEELSKERGRNVSAAEMVELLLISYKLGRLADRKEDK